MEKINLTKDGDKQLQVTSENEHNILTSFYHSIANRRPDIVSDLITRELISPDTPNLRGETPLLAAVRANDPNIIRALISLGANVDGYGQVHPLDRLPTIQRTPLQFAAAEGKLSLVKILRELGADDSLVAPDGAIALRLAAENGHREIVECLPARRAGAWKRWKATHAKEMRRIRRILATFGSIIKFFAWRIPRFFCWTLPKETWERRHRVGGWCRRQIKEFPRRTKEVAKLTLRGIKKVPKIIKKVPRKVWEAINRLPRAVWIILRWIGNGARRIGGAVAEAVKRILSFLHTAFTAIVDVFQAITLQDIVNAFHNVLRAVFIAFPKATWWFIANFSNSTFEAMKAAFGMFGQILWWLGDFLFKLVLFLPVKFWEILAACGRSTVKGVDEVLVWINPKRM